MLRICKSSTHRDKLHLSHIDTLLVGIFLLPLVSEGCEDYISEQDRDAEAPHQGDGIEEVSIPRARVDP